MSFLTEKSIALNDATRQLKDLETILTSIKKGKVDWQYIEAINRARTFISEKRTWIDQVRKDILKLDSSVTIQQAKKITKEAEIAIAMIKSYNLI